MRACRRVPQGGGSAGHCVVQLSQLLLRHCSAHPAFAPTPQVGSLSKPEYSLVFEQLYLGVMAQLVRFVPPDINIKVRDAGASWQYLRVLCWIAAPCTL